MPAQIFDSESEWVHSTIDETCIIEYGTRVTRKRDAGTIYPVYGGGGATFQMDSYNREDRMVVSRFAMSETCTRFVEGKFFLNDSGLTLRPKDELVILPNFLDWLVHSLNDEIYSLGRGTAQKNLNMDEFRKRSIQYPKDISEQQRIVSILDEAFSKIRIAQNNLNNNREEAIDLIKSCVDEVFSGTIDSGDGKSPVLKLGELCDVITKGTTPTSVGYQFVESGINFVKVESITTNGEFLEHKFAKITSECHEGLKRSQLRNEDILFSIAGALGRTAYVTESILPANTNQALAIIRLKKSDSVHPQYILKSLSTGFALDQIEKNRAGAAQQNLSLTQMKAFEIPLPSIEVQEQISLKIDIILNNAISLQNSIERKATGYIELKQSILQEAFSGNLTGGIAT